MVERWYPSKVDWWLAAVMAFAPFGVIVGLVATIASGETAAVIPLVIGTAVVLAVYLGLVFPMRYGIDETHIVVRHGLVRQRIPLAEITEVRPTRNPLSSPALSLDRIAIRFGTGFFKSAMISPREKTEFLDELAMRAKLRRDVDRLVR